MRFARRDPRMPAALHRPCQQPDDFERLSASRSALPTPEHGPPSKAVRFTPIAYPRTARPCAAHRRTLDGLRQATRHGAKLRQATRHGALGTFSSAALQRSTSHARPVPSPPIATISTLTRRRWRSASAKATPPADRHDLDAHASAMGFHRAGFLSTLPPRSGRSRGPAPRGPAPRGPAPRRFSTAQYNRVGILHTAHITNSFYWTPSPPPRSALGSARRPRRVRPTQLNTLASPALDPRLHSPQSRRKWQL